MAIDLITRRFERLEKAQKQTTEQLVEITKALGRVVAVLETHTHLFERMEDAIIALTDRVDRLSTAIMQGRTKDLARFDDIDRRLRALERPRPRRRKN